MNKSVVMVATLSLALLVSGCGIFSSDKDKARSLEPVTSVIGVNAYLWQAAMDTLHFMPLRSVDPAGGVIVTDWFIAPDNINERVQVNARFASETLRSDGIRIHVIRQVRQGDDWITAPVQASTELEIEEAILTRARELRVETLD